MSAPNIHIYSPRDTKTPLLSLPIYSGSTRKFTLMSEDYITLKFSLAAAVFFPIGSFCDLPSDDFCEGGRYVVTALQSPTLDTATGAYTYELKMEAEYRLWANHVFKYTPANAGREAAWSLTAVPKDFLTLLVNCIAADGYRHHAEGGSEEGDEYTYEIGSDVKATDVKTISFSNTNLLDALADIAEQWDTEWYVVGNVIHLGRCEEAETDNPVELKEGDNLESISRSDSQTDYATRMFVFGGESNIPARYRKSLIFDVINLDTSARTIEDTFRLLTSDCFTTSVRESDPFYTYKGTSAETYNNDFAEGTDYFYCVHTYAAVLRNKTTERAFKFSFAERTYDLALKGNFTGDRTFTVTISAQLYKGTSVVEEQVIATYTDTTAYDQCRFENGAFEADVEFDADNSEEYTLRLVYTYEIEATRADTTAASAEITASADAYSVYHGDPSASVYVTFKTGALEGQTVAATWNINRDKECGTFTLADGTDLSDLKAGNQFIVHTLDKEGKTADCILTGRVKASYFTSDTAEQMTLNGVVESRLMLPLTWDAEVGDDVSRNYLDAEKELTPAEIVETIVCNDDIYPRFTTKDEATGTTLNGRATTAIGLREGTVTNAQTDEKETVNFFCIQDDGFNFDEEAVLSGETLQIQFQSGKLCGLTFDVGFHAKAENTDFREINDSLQVIDKTKKMTGQIFEIVRSEDYGRPLPDSTLYPVAGDRYVLIGWDSTFLESTNLVEEAENELLEWAKEYRDKLKIDPSTYTATLMSRESYGYNTQTADLDKNYSLLASLGLGTRVRLYSDAFFKDGYRDSRIIGFERQLDIPFDSPIYTIGETASYSRLGELTDDIEELTLNGTNIAKRAGGSSSSGTSVSILRTTDATTPTDQNVLSALRSLRSFLRKDEADTAAELIQFLKGITIGKLAKYGITGEGSATLASVLADSANLEKTVTNALTAATAKLGQTTITNLVSLLTSADSKGDLATGIAMFLTDNKVGRIETDELLVRNKAIFNELEKRKLSYSGGNFVFSPAGSTLERVTVIDANNKEYEINDAGKYLDANGNEVTAKTYRCYCKADDGTTATLNTWKVGDQARCEVFDLAETGTFQKVANRYYWRLVTGVGNDYIDLSATDCDTNSDIPAASDVVAHMGNRSDTTRQGFIYIQSEGEGSPAFCEYVGVHSYSLEGCLKTRISPTQGNIFTGTVQLVSGNTIYRQPVYRGDYVAGETYNYYDQVTYDGELWLCIVAEPNTTTETPSDASEVWQRVTNNAEAGEWQLIYENDGAESVDTGETRRVIIKALKGVTDRTAEITTWKIERYTGDTTEAQAADAVWNAAHTSFQTQLDADGHPYVELTLDDLGDDVNSARFTVTTTSPDTDDNVYITDTDGNILTTDSLDIITYN